MRTHIFFFGVLLAHAVVGISSVSSLHLRTSRLSDPSKLSTPTLLRAKNATLLNKDVALDPTILNFIGGRGEADLQQLLKVHNKDPDVDEYVKECVDHVRRMKENGGASVDEARVKEFCTRYAENHGTAQLPGAEGTQPCPEQAPAISPDELTKKLQGVSDAVKEAQGGDGASSGEASQPKDAPQPPPASGVNSEAISRYDTSGGSITDHGNAGASQGHASSSSSSSSSSSHVSTRREAATYSDAGSTMAGSESAAGGNKRSSATSGSGSSSEAREQLSSASSSSVRSSGSSEEAGRSRRTRSKKSGEEQAANAEEEVAEAEGGGLSSATADVNGFGKRERGGKNLERSAAPLMTARFPTLLVVLSVICAA